MGKKNKKKHNNGATIIVQEPAKKHSKLVYLLGLPLAAGAVFAGIYASSFLFAGAGNKKQESRLEQTVNRIQTDFSGDPYFGDFNTKEPDLRVEEIISNFSQNMKRYYEFLIANSPSYEEANTNFEKISSIFFTEMLNCTDLRKQYETGSKVQATTSEALMTLQPELNKRGYVLVQSEDYTPSLGIRYPCYVLAKVNGKKTKTVLFFDKQLRVDFCYAESVVIPPLVIFACTGEGNKADTSGYNCGNLILVNAGTLRGDLEDAVRCVLKSQLSDQGVVEMRNLLLKEGFDPEKNVEELADFYLPKNIQRVEVHESAHTFSERNNLLCTQGKKYRTAEEHLQQKDSWMEAIAILNEIVNGEIPYYTILKELQCFERVPSHTVAFKKINGVMEKIVKARGYFEIDSSKPFYLQYSKFNRQDLRAAAMEVFKTMFPSKEFKY